MMEGIDMEDIRAWDRAEAVRRRVLTQNAKNQNTNYRKLFRETLENDMITYEKNQVGVEDPG